MPRESRCWSASMWCWTRSGRTTVSACVTWIYSDHDPRHEVACDYQARIHSNAAMRYTSEILDHLQAVGPVTKVAKPSLNAVMPGPLALAMSAQQACAGHGAWPSHTVAARACNAWARTSGLPRPQALALAAVAAGDWRPPVSFVGRSARRVAGWPGMSAWPGMSRRTSSLP